MVIMTNSPYNIRIINNVTAERALAVEYTNNTGRTMFVFVSLTHAVDAAATAFVQGEVAGAAMTVSGVVNTGHTAGSTITVYGQVTLVIPPGSTYQLTSFAFGGGVNAILNWYEAI